MTVITLVKSIPASVMYSGSGLTTINLKNFSSMVINVKKSLVKYSKFKTASNYNAPATESDQADNQVIDLKRIEQNIKLGGWLEDDATDTAWNKFWKLIAMQTRGGALSSLTIGTAVPLVFPSASPPVYPTSTPAAFIESVTGNIESDDTGDITASFSAKPVRIRVDLDIYLGYERASS